MESQPQNPEYRIKKNSEYDQEIPQSQTADNNPEHFHPFDKSKYLLNPYDGKYFCPTFI